jgi:hypothetical protein
MIKVPFSIVGGPFFLVGQIMGLSKTLHIFRNGKPVISKSEWFGL